MTLSVIYVLLALQLRNFTVVKSDTTLFWLPGGIALAFLLLKGSQYWPAVFIGALTTELYIGNGIGSSLCIALGNTLEPLCGVWLLTQHFHFNKDLTTTGDFLKLMVTTCICSGISALIDPLARIMTQQTGDLFDLVRQILYGWKGNALGIIFVVPLLLIWQKRPSHWLDRNRWPYTLIFLLSAFFSGQMAFLDWFFPAPAAVTMGLGYWIFLLVAWAAIAFGRHGASLIVAMSFVQALYGAINDAGFFAQDMRLTGLASFWQYFFTLNVTGVCLAINIEERQHSKRTEKKQENDDTTSYWLSTQFPLTDSQGVDYVGGVGIDMTPIKQMAQTAQHFEAIVRSSSDAIISYTLDGKINSWNPAAESTFGFSSDEIMGHSIDKLLPSHSIDKTLHLLEQIQQGCVIQNRETLRLRQDGSPVCVCLTISPIYDTEGKIIGASEIARDITLIRQQQLTLYEKSQQFRAAVETSIDGFLMFNEYGNIIEVNDAYLKKSGYSRDELLGMMLSDLEPEQLGAQTEYHMDEIRQQGQTWFETTHRMKNGQTWSAEIAISQSTVSRGVFFSFVKDATERKKWEKQLWYQANFDPLTELPNRLLFYDRLATALSQAKRNSHFTALIFLDLDGFKPVNDRYGHDAGDWALKTVAQRWGHCIRKNDMIARLGGDEFAVIIAKLEHVEEALAVAQKLIEALLPPIMLPGEVSCLLGVSAGISIFPTHATEINTLLNAADAAMYASKAKGKNHYSLSNATPNAPHLHNDWINFNDCQLLGVPELDRQHRQLVHLANQLRQAIIDKTSNDRIKQLFDNLQQYLAFHFETEHHFMIRHQDPDIARHEQEHALLADQLTAIAEQSHRALDLAIMQTIQDGLFVDINRLDKHWAQISQHDADKSINKP